VLRAGRRLATDLHAPWIALAVEARRSTACRRSAASASRRSSSSAERSGGETLVVRGERVASRSSRSRASRTSAASSSTGRRRRLVGVALDAAARARRAAPRRGIDVIVTSGLHEDETKAGRRPRRSPTPWREYPLALAPVATATLVCWLLRGVFGLADNAMVYLLAVLLAASRSARGPSLLAAVASVLALDFFFVNPVLTFAVGDARHVLTFLVMLVAGFLLGNRTVLIREQAEAAAERERRTATLYGLSRAFADEEDPQAVARIAAEHLRDLLAAESAVYLPGDGGLAPAAATKGFDLDEGARDGRRALGVRQRPAGGARDGHAARLAGLVPAARRRARGRSASSRSRWPPTRTRRRRPCGR
jgi:two-component system sensor histidine kinase KdpD